MYRMTKEILQTLHEEHLKTLGLLDRFEGLLRRCGPDAAPSEADGEAAALMAEVVVNMEDEADRHFSFEETYLFPRFSQFADAGIPAMLQGEHEAIRPLSRRLGELAAAAKAEGFTAERWREFHRVGLELVERELFHIQKEEMGFLPALDQMLSSDDAEELAQVYARERNDD